MASNPYTNRPSLSPFQIGAVYGAISPTTYYVPNVTMAMEPSRLLMPSTPVPAKSDSFTPLAQPDSHTNQLQLLTSSQPPAAIAASPKEKQNPTELLSKAGLYFLTALLLRHLPASHSRMPGTLISPDWKEWAKVGLGIAGISQVNQAMNWHPPLWLSAMTNVILVNPLVAGFSKRNLVQGIMLAPFVGALVQGSHWLSDKAEKPLQDTLNIPPLATRAFFSLITMLAGLKVFPRINNAIPQMDASAKGAALETGVMTSCANGCCSSLICVNDAGQLGTMLVRSVRQDHKQDHKKEPI
jgi:hypothetical protein